MKSVNTTSIMDILELRIEDVQAKPLQSEADIFSTKMNSDDFHQLSELTIVIDG